MVFQVIAIAVFTVFYGCYFMKMIGQRRRGIQTDQLGKGKVGFVRWIEVTVKVSAVLVFAAGLASVFLGRSRGPLWVRTAGAAVSAAGTALFIAAVVTMRDSWRAGVPIAILKNTDSSSADTGGTALRLPPWRALARLRRHPCSAPPVSASFAAIISEDCYKTDRTELVTTGVYQFSRNPAFLGFDLLHTGILLMFFSRGLCAASVFAMVMYHLQIVNVEEDFLLTAFGDAYLDYKRRVRRYIGRRRQSAERLS